MPKLGFAITEMTPVALADGPRAVLGGSSEMIQELCSLGLSHETSLGILKVLLRRGTRSVATDPAEW